MENRKDIYFLVGLVILLIAINYPFIDGFLKENFSGKEFVEVERVIDGDTVVINGSSARLLGINCPEKGEHYYLEAKEFLENLVLNKTLEIERYGKDLYNRGLVYLFDSGKNINLEVVEEGFGNYYFPEGKQRYYGDFVSGWESCVKKEINLCKKSLDKCANCIVLESFGYGKNVVLKNNCSFNCDLSGWSVKDEGRKKFIFESFVLGFGEKVEITAEDFDKEYVWTKTGDTLFLRDSEENLVLWRGY